MSLTDRINDDLKASMKAKDADRTRTLRSLKALLKIDASETTLTKQEELTRIQKAAKQRRESADLFSEAGRDDLAQKERIELEIIESYLPAQLTAEEVEAEVKAAIDESGARKAKDIGLVMKVLMPKLKGKADGKLIQETAKRLLTA